MGRKHNIFVTEDDRKPEDRGLTRPGAFTILLLNPRIPQNTGSIARMCAGTGTRLELVNPFFKIDDSKLKRAGLDYWHLLDVKIYSTFEEWREAHPQARLWFCEVGTPNLYSNVSYSGQDVLVFGDEQEGLAPSILEQFPNQGIRIPQSGIRSLNLATATAIVLFEAIRQTGWNAEGA